ncbi:SDR family NAD(P)-dependent oxidoreductase [Humisphaera borealis]|uniref:SDR family oxidoreductase n=1 Tax=Humisphaera borealis TaxID=2807512 RepID=A0A7M2X069_9BACT|nr:SDR family oxidoreductase [Humisphaera borealis]QOV90491.1 SDR family oxidoreductase [Humisphaera borealis]
MRDLSGKRVVITGAAGGIGKAIALEFCRAGSRLILLDVNQPALEAAVADCRATGADAVGVHCDLADADAIALAADRCLAAFGGVDVLVNNAGIAFYGPTHEMRLDQWEKLMAVNLLAPIRLIHALLPSLREQPEAHILNIASITGLVPKRRIAAYQASKFGLVGLSQSLRAEYSPYGIGVTAVCCGFARTELIATAHRDGMAAKPRAMRSWWSVSPEYVARRAVAGVRANRGLVVVPFLARLFWWVQRLSPAILDLHGHWVHWRSNRRRRAKARRLRSNTPSMPQPVPAGAK